MIRYLVINIPDRSLALKLLSLNNTQSSLFVNVNGLVARHDAIYQKGT